MIKTYFYDAGQGCMIHDVELKPGELLANQESLLWVDLFNFTEAEINRVARLF